MSDDEQSHGVNGSREDSGVLANLPRARPQRASARRAASRNGASARNGTAEAAAKLRPPAGTKTAAEPVEKPLEKRAVKAVGESAASSTAKAARSERAAGRRPARGAAPRRASGKRARGAATEEPAPRQGFESEGESPGGSLQPPGAVELVASAAEIVGELAKAGVSTGERLLKDAVSRLPL